MAKEIKTQFSTLYIMPEEFKKIMYYAKAADGEVSGLGTIKMDEDKKLIVDKVFLLDQESSPGDTELDPEAISKLMTDMMKNEEDPSKLKFWWHCITGDTPILLADGRILAAEEVYKIKNPTIMSYGGAGRKIVPTKMSNKKTFKAPTFLVQTTLNREICVTGNHKLLCQDGWKEVSKLEVGEKIGIPGPFEISKNTILPKYIAHEGKCCYKQFNTRGVKLGNSYVKIPRKMSTELAELLGWIISEGNLDKKSNTLHISQKNKKTLKKINLLLYKIFGVRGEFYLPPSDKTRERCWEIRLTNARAVGNYLNQLGVISGRGIKRVPQCILQAPNHIKESFLKTMIEGDGSYDKRGRILYKRIYTVYKELVNDLTYLISMLGYRAGIRNIKQNFKNAKYDTIYDVYWNSTDKTKSVVQWVEIKNITPQGENMVYAFTVPKYKNYICGYGPIISHNSHDNMGCFWSGTDDECTETLSKEYSFSLVVNKRQEAKCRLDLYHPFRLTIDNIRIKQLTEEDEALKKACEEEVEEKVKKWQSKRNYGYCGYGNSYNELKSERITLKTRDLEDVKRFSDLMELHNSTAWDLNVIDMYIKETFREIIKARYEKKASCSQFGTWIENSALCEKCSKEKYCKFYTSKWKEEDGEPKTTIIEI